MAVTTPEDNKEPKDDSYQHLLREILALKTEIKDMKGGIKDMAQDAARQTILDAVAQEQNNQNNSQQPQADPRTQELLKQIPNLGIPNINPDMIKAVTELAQVAKGIMDAMNPQDDINNLSIGNEKMLKSIGARWLNILLGRADKDLQKIEKSVGITSSSMLHEVV